MRHDALNWRGCVFVVVVRPCFPAILAIWSPVEDLQAFELSGTEVGVARSNTYYIPGSHLHIAELLRAHRLTAARARNHQRMSHNIRISLLQTYSWDTSLFWRERVKSAVEGDVDRFQRMKTRTAAPSTIIRRDAQPMCRLRPRA